MTASCERDGKKGRIFLDKKYKKEAHSTVHVNADGKVNISPTEYFFTVTPLVTLKFAVAQVKAWKIGKR